MSQITLSPDASGSAIFTVAAPNSSTNRTLTLPDATATLVGDSATQTLTNKTLTAPTITGATITGSTVSGGVIVQGTAVASTSGTSIDFTGIPSWAKRITVMFAGVSLSGSDYILVQLGTSSGFTTTGYASTNQLGSASNYNSTSGFVLGGNGASRVMSGSMVIMSMGTGNIWIETNIVKLDTGNVSWGGGDVTVSGTVDRVRITRDGTNTFDAGTINIMYEG